VKNGERGEDQNSATGEGCVPPLECTVLSHSDLCGRVTKEWCIPSGECALGRDTADWRTKLVGCLFTCTTASQSPTFAYGRKMVHLKLHPTTRSALRRPYPLSSRRAAGEVPEGRRGSRRQHRLQKSKRKSVVPSVAARP
jgi:hypothetical protein